jgi:hypothetical protein
LVGLQQSLQSGLRVAAREIGDHGPPRGHAHADETDSGTELMRVGAEIARWTVNPAAAIPSLELAFLSNFRGDGAIERTDDEIEIVDNAAGTHHRGKTLAAMLDRAADGSNLDAKSA